MKLSKEEIDLIKGILLEYSEDLHLYWIDYSKKSIEFRRNKIQKLLKKLEKSEG